MHHWRIAMKFNLRFNPWFTLVLVALGFTLGWMFVEARAGDVDNLITATIVLLIIVGSILMARTINAQWIEDRARRDASDAVERAIADKYAFKGTPEELAEFNLSVWRD
jgi:predicted RND superfamily exporter protein